MTEPEVTNWHGWPPQVWDGKRWIEVPAAALVTKLQAEVAYWRAVADQRSGSEGGC